MTLRRKQLKHSGRLIYLQADFLASLLALPGSSEEQTTTVTSGLKCSALLKSRSPLGYAVRMCLESSIWHSIRSALIWKVKATKSNRLYYLLAPLARGTSERGSLFSRGMWPTPKAGDADFALPRTSGRSIEKVTHLATAAHYWRTPMAQEAGARVETLYTKDDQPAKTGERAYRKRPDGRMVLQSMTLNQQVQMLPTPTVNGNNNRKGMSPKAGDGLATVARGSQPQREKSGTLNPTWVEWLQGFPEHWTDLER